MIITFLGIKQLYLFYCFGAIHFSALLLTFNVSADGALISALVPSLEKLLKLKKNYQMANLDTV